MHMTSRARNRSGFTLIELLVVMAIIASLGALGIVGIPSMLRKADVTTCQDRLGDIHTFLFQYQDREGHLPRASGPEFVLAPWTEKNMPEHSYQNAKIFFCPSVSGGPDEDLPLEEAVTPFTIDYTGIDQEGQRKPMRVHDRSASEKVIVSNKIPIVESEADLDQMPHANTGFCILYLNGGTDFVEAVDFQNDYVVIGPESEFERFQNLVPGMGY